MLAEYLTAVRDGDGRLDALGEALDETALSLTWLSAATEPLGRLKQVKEVTAARLGVALQGAAFLTDLVNLFDDWNAFENEAERRRVANAVAELIMRQGFQLILIHELKTLTPYKDTQDSALIEAIDLVEWQISEGTALGTRLGAILDYWRAGGDELTFGAISTVVDGAALYQSVVKYKATLTGSVKLASAAPSVALQFGLLSTLAWETGKLWDKIEAQQELERWQRLQILRSSLAESARSIYQGLHADLVARREVATDEKYVRAAALAFIYGYLSFSDVWEGKKAVGDARESFDLSLGTALAYTADWISGGRFVDISDTQDRAQSYEAWAQAQQELYADELQPYWLKESYTSTAGGSSCDQWRSLCCQHLAGRRYRRNRLR